MIQINLLPDVKIKYIKAQRNKRLVILSSLVISAVSIGLLAMLASIVYGVQKVQLDSLSDSIKKSSTKLLAVQDVNKILTIQNQLNVLTGLHDTKPVVARLFTYLPQITPNDVQITSVELDFTKSTVVITGSAKTLESVNKYVDTLKFTNYTLEDGGTQSPVFDTVVLSSFGRTDKETTFKIEMKFEPSIFSSSNKNVKLVVPSIVSTRSQTEQPTALFKEEQK